MIVHSLQDQLCNVAFNLHGTRVIQSLVEALGGYFDALENEIFMLIRQLEGHMLHIATDPQGNHVLQTFLMSFKASELPGDSDLPGSEKKSKFT